jgi:site-specific DNA recombinase
MLTDDLRAALSGSDGTEALAAVRSLIERVTLYPAADGAGFEIALTGEIAALVDLALGRDGTREAAADRGRGLFLRSVKVVAGTGFEPVTFRL